MRAAAVPDFSARRNLELRIRELFKSFITDWCGYELAVILTAEAARRSSSFVRAVLDRQR